MEKNNPNRTMFGTHEFPSYEEILDAYSKEFSNYVRPKGDTIFGFWMQTIADLEFLDLELQGLTDEYHIDPAKRAVKLRGDEDFIRLRVAHLEKVDGKPIDIGDTYYREQLTDSKINFIGKKNL